MNIFAFQQISITMLVVLEGLDGAGKSTQVRRLKEYLETVSARMEYIHFPRYDAPVYGDLISRFLRGEFGSIEAVHPQLVALLFAEDRHAAAPSMRRILDEGGTVLLDRYVYSNFNLPKPDLNIFLDVPISFVEGRLESSRKGNDREYLMGRQDIHESDIDFQKCVRSIYLRQTELDPTFIRVDCSDADGRMLPPGAISEKVRSVVDEHIH